MTLDEAREALATTTRDELSDLTFGDAEVYWTRDGIEVACGYFGRDAKEVTFTGDDARPLATFRDADALSLRQCGVFGKRERNDNGGKW